MSKPLSRNALLKIGKPYLWLPKREILHPRMAGPVPVTPHFVPLGGAFVVVPGEMTFTESGNFIVPPFNTLEVDLWGGGASGLGADNVVNVSAGQDGGDTTFDGLTAGGGKAAQGQQNAPGGTASGGDINTNGGNGSVLGKGGDCPNGGTGGAARGSAGSGNPGNVPGGGGGGAYSNISGFPLSLPGGGAGAYVKKTYTLGDLTIGASLSVVVGAGGIDTSGYVHLGGAGARGEAKFVWY